MEGSDRALQAIVKKYYICDVCTVPNCADCSTILNTSCLTCKTRLLSDNLWKSAAENNRINQAVNSATTAATATCSVGCATCTSSGASDCLTCKDAYYKAPPLDGNSRCLPCPIANCLTCPNGSECTKCGKNKAFAFKLAGILIALFSISTLF